MFLKDALTFSADGKTLVKCDESYEGKVEVPGSMSELGLSPSSTLARILSVIIPNKVTTIGKDAFMHCDKITSVVLPDSITLTEEKAFWGCEKLTEIEIPKNVMKIETDAFVETYGNKRYVVAEGNSCFCEKNGAICSKDGKSLLHVPIGLETFTVPDGIVYINAENNDYESIAFESNDTLTSVTIPSSVIQIGAYTFMDCENLVELYMKHQTPLEAFDEKSDIDVAKVTLFVPRGSEEAYRAHPFYRRFARIVGE